MSGAYRFVSRTGWERWVDLPEPPPPTWKLHAPFPRPDVLPDVDAHDVSWPMEVHIFRRQPFNVMPWPQEAVYLEDGARIDVGSTFGANRPSLHRERILTATNRQIASVMHYIRDSKSKTGNPLGQVFIAAHSLERIASLLYDSQKETGIPTAQDFPEGIW